MLQRDAGVAQVVRAPQRNTRCLACSPDGRAQAIRAEACEHLTAEVAILARDKGCDGREEHFRHLSPIERVRSSRQPVRRASGCVARQRHPRSVPPTRSGGLITPVSSRTRQTRGVASRVPPRRQSKSIPCTSPFPSPAATRMMGAHSPGSPSPTGGSDLDSTEPWLRSWGGAMDAVQGPAKGPSPPRSKRGALGCGFGGPDLFLA